MTESVADAQARYVAAAHAMQTGVKMMLEYDPSTGDHKEMRTGLNSAMVEFGALIGLLFDKGIVEPEEFWPALADKMEEERDNYAQQIKDHLGTDTEITLL